VNHMLIMKKKYKLVILSMLLIAGMLAVSSTPSQAFKTKSKKKSETKITSSELQATLMSYADILSTALGQLALSIKENELPTEVRTHLLTDLANTVFSVYTNAADPDPLIGLLDTAVIISIGKMIYVQHWQKKYGASLDGVVKVISQLEKEIWKTVSEVLTEEQKSDLQNMILTLRKENPDLLDFTQLRLKDIASLRKLSELESKVKSGGFLAPVSDATKQIEATRQLAERAMFLATRLPLMAGAFMDIWLSHWLANPDVKDLTTDLKKMSTSVHEVTSLVEKLPDQLQQVSTTTINQVMDRFAKEGQNLIRDLGAEQQRLSGLIKQFHETVNAGETLITSLDGLAERSGLSPDNPLTFDINAYKKTIQEMRGAATEMTTLVEALNQLVVSPQIQEWLPHMKTGIEQLSGESRRIINHVFLMAFLTIVLSVACFFALRLAYQYSMKRFGFSKP
jgi:hypothetical protein